MLIKNLILSIIAGFLFQTIYAQEEVPPENKNPWPEITNTTKPWTRWWWMGNAVDKANLRTNLIKLQKAGIGGVEITPIYGAKGEEKNYINYLSPKWMEMLDYTIKTADSLNMEVDMTLGTGWPYGGPQVNLEHAATKLVTQKYDIKKGQRFKEKIELNASKEKHPATLQYVLAYGKNGDYKNLTEELKEGNFLNWKARNADYTLYAVFAGKTGQQVKRAAPGGEGYTLDHYSNEALNSYLVPFDKAFSKSSEKIRSIFNDSYEVYGTDFTPAFFKEFQNRRGYDLKPHLELLLDTTSTEEGNRIIGDYRETLSDLLLENFDKPWTDWANKNGFKSRLQAHGSPGNLIDLYASADIPECETFGSMPFDIPGLRREKEDIREGDADPVMLKFSSSAAHISGKPLTSSETFTWLRDHFKTALSQTKPEAEELFLNGINHIFLHGNTYSPERAGWPGWKFYASVNFSPNNTIWNDAPELFSYIAKCQSMLQSGKPDNETLLYWPIYDEWDKFQGGSLFFQFKIHSLDEWLHGTSFYNITQKMMKKGYGVDFISDRFIAEATTKDGKIQLPGGNYKSLIVPDSNKMPLETLQKLLELKEQGANIIFNGFPESVPGLYEYEKKNKELEGLIEKHSVKTVELSQLFTELENTGVYPESLVETGLKYIRREVDGGKIYFLVNHTSETINKFIPLQSKSKEVVLFDPLTGNYGKAETKIENGLTKVRVNIAPGESFFLKTEEVTETTPWKYYETTRDPQEITGTWHLSFEKGGPKLPSDIEISELKSWTLPGDEYEAFSGSGTYEIHFDIPNAEKDNWQLDLGDVRESAQVWINDKYIGTAWSVPFILQTGKLKKGKNTLKVKVTNLAANRIRAKELRGEEWKIFHEINMVDKDYKKFDATKWDPMPSGLLGPVLITPLKVKN
jgi:hypothetical protein